MKFCTGDGEWSQTTVFQFLIGSMKLEEGGNTPLPLS